MYVSIQVNIDFQVVENILSNIKQDQKRIPAKNDTFPILQVSQPNL